MAEAILRDRLKDLADFTVASAGTDALVGLPPTPQTVAVLTALGLPSGPSHQARQLTPELVRQADLVLALSRQHRRSVAELEPRATQRIFTLREFGYVSQWIRPADIVEARLTLPIERLGADNQQTVLRAAVAAVGAKSGLAVAAVDPEELDVQDPFGRPLEAYAESAVRILPAVEATAEFLKEARALSEAARGPIF
jgi:protein-tyrosine phosphatase